MPTVSPLPPQPTTATKKANSTATSSTKPRSGNEVSMTLLSTPLSNIPPVTRHSQIIDVDAEYKISVALDLMRDYDHVALPVYGMGVMRESLAPSAVSSNASVSPDSAKTYIGMITILDIVVYLLSETSPPQASDSVTHALQTTPVAAILGETRESSFMTLEHDMSLLDVLQAMTTGTHRVLVENEGEFRMLTQFDVVKYIYENSQADSLIQSVMDTPLTELSLAHSEKEVGFVLVVEDGWSTKKAVSYMSANALQAVAVVRDGSLVGTLSLSDLRKVLLPFLVPDLTIADFLKCAHHVPTLEELPPHVTCSPHDTLRTVMKKVLESHVHRVWVVREENGKIKPVDVVSLTDILSAVIGEVP